jgi:rhodanese-related sulfurtransferase
MQSLLSTIHPASLFACMAGGNSIELLDVRTAPEYATAHVGGAKLIPLHELEVEGFLAGHPRGKPIYVICQAGDRAKAAIERFQQAGCDDCVLVEGGTQMWIEAGLPVVRGTSNVLPIMRQVQIVIGALSAVSAVLALAINPWFAVLPLLLGCGLLFAGITGTCGMALLLARMPWNQAEACKTGCCASGK